MDFEVFRFEGENVQVQNEIIFRNFTLKFLLEKVKTMQYYCKIQNILGFRVDGL
jgi:hypothetical protein